MSPIRPSQDAPAGILGVRQEIERACRDAERDPDSVTLVAISAMGWRASSIISRLLGDWAVGAVAEQSGGVYRLEPGRVVEVGTQVAV